MAIMNCRNLILQAVVLVLSMLILHHSSLAQAHPLSKEALENFRLIDNFEKDKASFKRDTFDVSDVSVNGGQAVYYHSKGKPYSVFDLQLFDETGQLHYLFFNDLKSNLKITKQIEQIYNKSKHAKGFNENEITTYYSNEGSSFNVYNVNRHLISDPDKDKKNKIEKLFRIVKEKK